jgi:hypothetical protein
LLVVLLVTIKELAFVLPIGARLDVRPRFLVRHGPLVTGTPMGIDPIPTIPPEGMAPLRASLHTH